MNDPDVIHLQTLLQKWGGDHFRDYPWRHSQDPYKIMIAEFMLHRTRADQVVSVYNSFLLSYPDIFCLAKADYCDMTIVTNQLGLHWRSQHFIDAARYIINNYDGTFPESGKELIKIPGVGEYVCGAILTICYNKPYPVIDANIARFINRFFGLNLLGEIRRKKAIKNVAEKLFNVENPGLFLFSILDFSAAICKAKTPDHNNCPLKNQCAYKKN